MSYYHVISPIKILSLKDHKVLDLRTDYVLTIPDNPSRQAGKGGDSSGFCKYSSEN